MISNKYDKLVVTVFTTLYHPVLMPILFIGAMMVHQSVFNSVSGPFKLLVLRNVAIITLLMPLVSLGFTRLISYWMKENLSPTTNRITGHLILFIAYISAISILYKLISLKLSLLIFGLPIILMLIYWIMWRFRVTLDMKTMSIGAFLVMIYLFTLSNIALFDALIPSVMLLSGATMTLFLIIGSSLRALTLSFIFGAIAAGAYFSLVDLFL